MNMKKLPAALLCVCLLLAALSPAACAAEAPALDDFVDRYGPLLGDGLDTLTDWLKGQTADLAPELRETLRDVDTEDLFSDLKDLVGDTKGLDDAALKARIEEVAEAHGIHLVESQVKQMMKLCRTLENLDVSELRERTDSLGEQLKEAAPGGLRGVWNSVVNAFKDAGDWISRQWKSIFG